LIFEKKKKEKEKKKKKKKTKATQTGPSIIITRSMIDLPPIKRHLCHAQIGKMSENLKRYAAVACIVYSALVGDIKSGSVGNAVIVTIRKLCCLGVNSEIRVFWSSFLGVLGCFWGVLGVI
jgi:hypothetical protein